MRGMPIRRLAPLHLCLALFALRAAAAESPPSEGFDIWEFEISGSAQLPPQAIERAVYPFLGPDRTVDDVERASAALEALYKEAGYGTVIVNIPEQDVVDGLVKLEVVEGTVDRLLVTGTRYFSPAQLRAAVPSLAPGQVPDLRQVQKELQAVNAATSDRRVTPILRPGRLPGTVEAELKVDDELPVHGTLEINNQYTRDTTKPRLAASLGYDNLWQRQHSAGIGYQTAPENTDDVTVLYGTYSARLGGSPWLVSGYLVDSDTAVSTVGTLGVIGKGQIAGLRFIRPLPVFAGGLPRVTIGLDYKDFDESIALAGGQPTIETPITYGVLSLGWGVTFPADDRTTSLNVQGVLGPRFLGNEQDEFDRKRTGASAGFAHLNVGLTHERGFPGDVRLKLAFNGQLSDGPMISNEQFGFGGASSVRGYLESEQFVDNGFSGQFEILSADWGKALYDDASARLAFFTDVGLGNLNDPLPEQDDRFFLWSVGLGLRATLWDGFNASLDWAVPLKDTADGDIEGGDSRVHFSTGVSF